MAFRLYIVPQIGTGKFGDGRRPKYFDGLTEPKATMQYGFQPFWLVGADLPAATDSAIIANADVFDFPFNLDTNISGGAVNQTRSQHEAMLIPLQTVPPTYRLLARYDAGVFEFMQRLNIYSGNVIVIDSIAKLNTQWQTIPAPEQQAVLDAAASLSMDTSFITPTMQIRAILKNFSDQWGSKPFNFNEFVF